MLWIAKNGLDYILQAIFLSSIGITFIYVFYPFFYTYGIEDTAGYVGAAGLAIQLTFLLMTYPEWYVIDIAGIILAAGVARFLVYLLDYYLRCFYWLVWQFMMLGQSIVRDTW